MLLKSYLMFILFLLVVNLQAQSLIAPSSLPDVEDYVVIRTNPSADTIILALHGGPTESLYAGSFIFMENIPTFSVVEIEKHEMLSNLFLNDSLTFEQGIATNDTTAALIEKAIQYFKNQDKTVVLLGHSWGAIVMCEYMDDYGLDQVHKIIPMEGRLNMPQEFVEYLLEGYLPTFASDGLTILLNTPQNSYQQSLLNLGAAAFSNRYVDSLANLDLGKMMYTFAQNDMQTGALIPEEINFLNNNGAFTLPIPFGQHGDSFNSIFQNLILGFIREEFLTDINEPLVKQNHLKLFPTLASNSIQIESDQKGFLNIYDMMGNLIHQKLKPEHALNVDISNLENGQYIALVQGPSNSISSAKFQVVR